MRWSPVEIAVVIIAILALFGGTIIPKITKRVKDSKKALDDGISEIKGE